MKAEKGSSLRRFTEVWRWIGVLILATAGVYVMSSLRGVLYPLVFGLIIALALLPAVKKFEERKFSRAIATTLAFLVTVIILALLAFFVVGQLSSLGQEFFAIDENNQKVGVAYQAFDKVKEFYNQLDARFGLGSQGRQWIEDLPQKLAASWQEAATTAGNVFSYTLAVAGSLFNFFSLALLTPLFAFLILLEFETIRGGLLKLYRKENREHRSELFSKIEIMLGRFLRGRLLTGFLKGLGQAILLIVIGAPYPVLTGILSCVCSFVPVVGPVIAFIPTLILAAVHGSWTVFVIAVIILILGEVIEGYLLIPKIIGSAIGLGTLETILALLIGAALLGFVGLFLAIPLAALGKIILLDYLERRDRATAKT